MRNIHKFIRIESKNMSALKNYSEENINKYLPCEPCKNNKDSIYTVYA